jgi:hypothetical protein
MAHALRNLVLATILLSNFPAMANGALLPTIQKNGSAVQLMVDGKPWIALAGEIHNSTASNVAYMEPVWDRLSAQNINTLITPAYWELVEPEEGRFDFTIIDEQIKQARKRNIRIVLLWFGTIKNAKSTYAPAWVLGDRSRFPRAAARGAAGASDMSEPSLSVFSKATVQADANAFAGLMEHLSTADREHTVIAVQVENEAGLLDDSRDRSPIAERAWNSQVPAAFMSHLSHNKSRLEPSLEALWHRSGDRQSGTWAQVFGNDWQAEEVFMAWGVSSFIDTVAAAGKARLRLPMYTNAWLGPQNPKETAGTYPSGGPVPRVFDVWRAGALNIDWLSPDIYLDDFDGWAARYARPDNLLFVPEARFVVGNLSVALGQHRAIGFAPFGIEDGLPGNEISEAYGLLKGMWPMLADAQARSSVIGFALRPGETRETSLGNYVLKIRGARETMRKMFLDMGIPVPVLTPPPVPQNIGTSKPELSDQRPSGIILQLGPDEFLVLGKDLDISFAPKGQPGATLEIGRIQEGRYLDGQWVPGRILNGDERLSIVPFDKIGMARIRLIRPNT